MKKTLLISTLLAFALATGSANALTAENISITETGGVTVEGGASASGGDDASANVQSIISSQGGDTRVRIEIQTSADGETHATTVEKTLQNRERLEVSARDAAMTIEAEAEAEGGMAVAQPDGPVMSDLLRFDRFSSFLENLFNLVFFFW